MAKISTYTRGRGQFFENDVERPSRGHGGGGEIAAQRVVLQERAREKSGKACGRDIVRRRRRIHRGGARARAPSVRSVPGRPR